MQQKLGIISQSCLLLPESGSGVTSLLRLESLSEGNSLLDSGVSLWGDSLIAGGGGVSGGGGGINMGGFCCTALVLGVTMPISGAKSANDWSMWQSKSLLNKMQYDDINSISNYYMKRIMHISKWCEDDFWSPPNPGLILEWCMLIC